MKRKKKSRLKTYRSGDGEGEEGGLAGLAFATSLDSAMSEGECFEKVKETGWGRKLKV
jgi:hypothetical protein